MIKSKKGKIVIKGTDNEILADFMRIARAFDSDGYDKDYMKKLVDVAYMNDDEYNEFFKGDE